MAAYLDNSFIYALVDTGDRSHAVAQSAYEGYQGTLCLSSYVLAEVMSLLTKRFSKAVALHTGHDLVESAQTRVIYPSAAEVLEAWDLFAAHPDWDFDLVDAISFTMMRDLAIDTALTLDHHFAQMGFTVLPA